MATMPRGEPRSVPDPDGDLYDEWVRRKRAAEQLAAAQASGVPWLGSPARMDAQDAMASAPPQPAPDPARALEDRRIRDLRADERNVAGQASETPWLGSPARMDAQDSLATAPDPRDTSMFPVVGPALDAVDDAKNGRPWNAAADAVLGLLDVGFFDTGLGVMKAVDRGVADNIGRRTADAARKQLRRRGVAVPGQEIHHSFPLNGIGRNVENWRNHPAFLKVLPQESHRRITGSWAGKPQFDHVRGWWVSTPNWMKTVPAWALGNGVAVLSQPPPPTPASSQAAASAPALYGAGLSRSRSVGLHGN